MNDYHYLQLLTANLDKLATTPIGLAYLALLTKKWRHSGRFGKSALCAYALVLLPVNILLWLIGGGAYSMDVFIMLFNIITGMALAAWLQAYTPSQFFFIFMTVLVSLHIMRVGKTICHVRWGIQPIITCFGLGLAIGLILYFFFSSKIMRIMDTLKISWWKLSLVPSLLCLSFMAVTIPDGGLYRNRAAEIPAILLSVVAYSFYLLVYYIFTTTLRQQEEESSQNMLVMQIRHLERQMANFEQMNTQMKTLRHDLRHYVAAMNGCLETGNTGEARRILAAIDENIGSILEQTDYHQYTGEPLLDSVLSYHRRRALNSHIDFQICFTLPTCLEISITDLTILLSNALENAMNACEKCPQKNRRVILSGVRSGSQYFLELSNTYTVKKPENGGAGETPAGHGYGSKSIKALAARNHAICRFSADPDAFRLQLLFPIRQETETSE